MNERLRYYLVPWADPDFLTSPVPMRKRAFNISLMTDASGCLGKSSSASNSKVSMARRMGPNVHELDGDEGYPSVLGSLPGKTGRSVCEFSQTAALACLRRQGSLTSEALWTLSRDLLVFAEANKISLVPVHLKGRLKVLADQASRDKLISTEWRLDCQPFKT